MHFVPLEDEKQQFIFYVAQDLDQSVRTNVQQLLNELAVSRIWSVAPPSFIDAIDEEGTEVLGGMLEIYSARQPNILSIDMDSRNLDDVEELICAVTKLSEKESLSFEFQLDATFVGAIDDGVVDRVLLEGLLVPWRNHIKRKG